MFSYCKDLFNRHRKKILFSTGVIAVSYVVSSYVTSKITELQEKLKEENFAKEQIKRRFKQTQNDCYMTFLSLLPVLTEPIYEELNVEDITKQLQSKRQERQKSKTNIPANNNDPALSTVMSDDFSTYSQSEKELQQQLQQQSPKQPKSKTQLWNDLKNESLTRFLTLLYCESLLIVFLHLQLNILSRKSYLETAIKLASKNKGIKLQNESGISLDLNLNLIDDDDDLSSGNSANNDENMAEQAFLSFSWWLLNKGWIEIKNKIELSVEDIFGEVNPRQEMTIDDFATLINRTQKIIDKDISEFQEQPRMTQSTFTLSPNQLPQQQQSQQQSSQGSSSTLQSTVIISSLLPPSNLEFFLLQQTNDVEFLSSFNNNLNNSENLSKLLDELKEYLNNEQVNDIISLLVTVGISKVLDNIVLDMIDKHHQHHTEGGSEEEQIMEVEPKEMPKVKLASFLASITKQSNQLSNNSLDNEILYTLNNLQELDDLSASVYANFD